MSAVPNLVPCTQCAQVSSKDNRHCPSPTCNWWRCEHCGLIADRHGRTMQGQRPGGRP